jgi:3-hydroxyisobutyrate dehydrogenase-like beta-hydroxyacid dehydrogenase
MAAEAQSQAAHYHKGAARVVRPWAAVTLAGSAATVAKYYSERIGPMMTSVQMTNEPVAKVAFIGTGLMGAPMVRRLLAAKLKVRVWNRTPDKTKSLIAAGAEAAMSPAEAANGLDAVFLCLSNSAAIESVLFAAGGVAHAGAAPPLLVDFSTIGPSDTERLADRLRARCGTAWVDAPVSGGVTGAEQGRLIIFCGGSPRDIDRLAPALDALAQRHTRIGELGTGQTLKLCNQLIVATNLVAIAEALALARASGWPPGSPCRCWASCR